MPGQFLAIIRNTFFESIRQPIVLVVLLVVTFVIILSNPLSAFTMEDDQRMLIDIGMATIFLCGALLASFIATGVLTREIENRTALTVLSKPVGRPLFVLGKFTGVAAALMLSTMYMVFVFMLVEMHSVLQTVRDPLHLPVIAFGVGAMLLGTGASVWCNYFYGTAFSSTFICIMTPLLGLAYVLALLFDPAFQSQPIDTAFKPNLWLGLVVLMMAILVLTAIAVAASARLGQVMTLVITLGAFLLGLLSDWLIGRRVLAIESTWLDRARAQGLVETQEVYRSFMLESGERITSPIAEMKEISTVPLTSMAEGSEQLLHGLLWTGRAVVPNFQILWLSDALTQSHVIPMRYIGTSCLYGLLIIVATLCLAVMLFQKREIG